MNVAVVGAGIAGATIAAELKAKGVDVTIYDYAGIANQCSYANGGQLSVCNSETWHTWSNVAKGLKWCLKEDAPLYLNPMPTPEKLTWLTGFMKNVVLNKYEANTLETIRLGLISRERYQEFHKIQDSAKQTGYEDSGMLHVYTNEKSFNKAMKVAEMMNANGVEWDIMLAKHIRDYDNNMYRFKNLVGGFITPQDSVVNIHHLVKWIIEKNDIPVIEKKVVDVRTFTNGVMVSTPEDSELGGEMYDKIVFANGHEVNKFSKDFGNFFNLYPIKGYSVTIQEDHENFPYVSLLDDDKKIVTSTYEYGDGRKEFRIAGTAEIGGKNTNINMKRIEPLLQWAEINFDIKPTEFKPWACLRPMTSSMMPYYDRSRFSDKVWYHIGHGHLGLTLAAGTAKLLSEKMFT